MFRLPTPMQARVPVVVFLVSFLVALGLGAVQAQDEFSIPGVDDPPSVGSTPSPSVGEPSGSEESTVTEYDNLLEKLVKQGGLAIWPLFALSLIVVGLTVYCLIDLNRGRFYPQKVINSLEDRFLKADLKGAMAVAEKSPTCLGQVMHGATEYVNDRGYQTLDDSALFDAMADVSQEFNRGRARTINYFSVIAQAAPMIGLLGTVSGMIKAFDKLGQKGMGDPASLAANISEALLTTASGLVIAVPTLFLYFYFRDRLTQLIASTDRHAYKLLNKFRRAIVSGGSNEPPPQAPPTSSAPDPEPFVPTPHSPSA